MHDDIKNFFLSGEISDTNLVKTKERLIEALEGKMRDEGYAPVLDIEPQFTTSFNEGKGRFEFVLTVYGTFVGKDEAWSTGGIMGGKILKKSTLLTK